MSTLTKKPAPRVSRTRRSPMPPKPEWKGYMTDEFAAYMQEYFRRMTPAEVRKATVEAGITDEHGNLTAPYRGGK
jgi:hypothetical protein